MLYVVLVWLQCCWLSPSPSPHSSLSNLSKDVKNFPLSFKSLSFNHGDEVRVNLFERSPATSPTPVVVVVVTATADTRWVSGDADAVTSLLIEVDADSGDADDVASDFLLDSATGDLCCGCRGCGGCSCR